MLRAMLTPRPKKKTQTTKHMYTIMIITTSFVCSLLIVCWSLCKYSSSTVRHAGHDKSYVYHFSLHSSHINQSHLFVLQLVTIVSSKHVLHVPIGVIMFES